MQVLINQALINQALININIGMENDIFHTDVTAFSRLIRYGFGGARVELLRGGGAHTPSYFTSVKNAVFITTVAV